MESFPTQDNMIQEVFEIQDRRIFPRFRCSFSLAVNHLDCDMAPDDPFKAKTVNVSVGGLKVQARKPFPSDSPISLTMAIKNQYIEFTGMVMYSKQLTDGRFVIGIRFEEISLTHLAYLAGYFHEILNQ